MSEKSRTDPSDEDLKDSDDDEDNLWEEKNASTIFSTSTNADHDDFIPDVTDSDDTTVVNMEIDDTTGGWGHSLPVADDDPWGTGSTFVPTAAVSVPVDMSTEANEAWANFSSFPVADITPDEERLNLGFYGAVSSSSNGDNNNMVLTPDNDLKMTADDENVVSASDQEDQSCYNIIPESVAVAESIISGSSSSSEASEAAVASRPSLPIVGSSSSPSVITSGSIEIPDSQPDPQDHLISSTSPDSRNS